jgi:hypothetical protein
MWVNDSRAVITFLLTVVFTIHASLLGWKEAPCSPRVREAITIWLVSESSSSLWDCSNGWGV